jgi:hypothetical protein
MPQNITYSNDHPVKLPVFANDAAIDAAVTAGTLVEAAGTIVFVTGQGLVVFNGTAWKLASDGTSAVT